MATTIEKEQIENITYISVSSLKNLDLLDDVPYKLVKDLDDDDVLDVKCSYEEYSGVIWVRFMLYGAFDEFEVEYNPSGDDNDEFFKEFGLGEK